MSTRTNARDAVRSQVTQHQHAPGPFAQAGVYGFTTRYLLEVIRTCQDGTVRAVGVGVEDALKEAGLQ